MDWSWFKYQYSWLDTIPHWGSLGYPSWLDPLRTDFRSKAAGSLELWAAEMSGITTICTVAVASKLKRWKGDVLMFSTNINIYIYIYIYIHRERGRVLKGLSAKMIHPSALKPSGVWFNPSGASYTPKGTEGPCCQEANGSITYIGRSSYVLTLETPRATDLCKWNGHIFPAVT